MLLGKFSRVKGVPHLSGRIKDECPVSPSLAFTIKGDRFGGWISWWKVFGRVTLLPQLDENFQPKILSPSIVAFAAKSSSINGVNTGTSKTK
jgi:hypothetical protein